MIELVVAKDVLSKILYEDQTFKRALNEERSLKSEHLSIKTTVSGLVGCELRHHFLFKKVLHKLHLEFSLDERTYLYLALANNHFYKKLDFENVSSFLKEVFDEKYNEIAQVLDPMLSLFDLFEVERKSVYYISVRFNLPKWLIKLFIREIGLSKTYRVVQTLCRPLDQTYRLNPYNQAAKELLEKNENVFSNQIYPEIVTLSRKDLHTNKNLHGEHLFRIDYHLKELVDNNQSELLQEVSIYSDEDDSLVLEEMARSKKLGVNVVCPNYDERTKLVRSVRLQKAKNINVFKASDLIGMKTGISRDQELIYCYPKSSSFSLINVYPDYIVRFRNPIIDEYIKNQLQALENCSEFVCENGKLIYIVNTLNKRETSEIIGKFLQSHKNFELVKEKQFIPEKNYGSFLYFAILKKVGEKHD